MLLNEELGAMVRELIGIASERTLEKQDVEPICRYMHAAKMFYDVTLGEEDIFRHRKTDLVQPDENGYVYVYDNGEPGGDTISFTYDYSGKSYAHTFLTLEKGYSKDSIDMPLYQLLSDIFYIMVSRDNMRKRLQYAEMTDTHTKIPNSLYIRNKFHKYAEEGRSSNFAVLGINIQNFKYVNEAGGSKAGDEAIIKYAHMLMNLTESEECAARLGGDNFVLLLKQENVKSVIERLRHVTISGLTNCPGRTFELSAWIGVSAPVENDHRSFGARLNECTTACMIGKSRLKLNVVFFSDELKLLLNQGREIMSLFYPAIQAHEFIPYFQPKVNMSTGRLIGFEALCRWIHEGKFIFPDQFIPILDKEGLIHELDMTIFRETCMAIKRWKEMGLNPPRISSNFSRKNLFVPDIEEKIYDTIIECGISVGDVEIEITESIQEQETNRLIAFVRKLKEYGLHIAIDDFGTGYSSLMLIHNIDADIIKIDKSFVDEIPGDRKSTVLIESIISIANNLNMAPIAEGVETEDQGRELMRLGCANAQGYFYSRPVDFNAATEIIRKGFYEAIQQLDLDVFYDM